MKKIIKILATVAVLVLGGVLIACGSPDEIYFTKDNMPRLTYVQGQELDFTDIFLTTEKKNKTETVPMSSEDVSVSGYNKDQLGEQTVTVTYKEISTAFKVTVIPRITAEGFDQNYFVGDSFNKQNGRIKVANDEAVISTVNMRDSAVTVTGFDSATAGVKTLTVNYNGYSGTFKVNVLSVANVNFKKPSKITYQSHEEEFDCSGGYFTVTSENNIIEKQVPLSAEMVSGFDLSVATIDNRTASTAAKQTLLITYLGYHFDFQISIRYSGVSIVKQRAEELKNVDHTATIDTTVGENAIDAINEYLALSNSDKEKITDNEKNTVARVATAYAYKCFVDETAKYSHTFTLKEVEFVDEQDNFVEFGGYFIVDCDAYADMVATLTDLKNSESPFIVYSNLLHKIETEFKDLEMSEDVNVDAYMKSLYLANHLSSYVELFEVMTSIYEAIEKVPETWDRESIKAADQVTSIERAYSRMIANNLYTEYYDMISSWRAKNDLYDILHTHYLYNKTYEDDASYVSQVWGKIPFPAMIQTLYNYIAAGYTDSYYELLNNVSDTTYFMTVYRDTVKYAEEIKNSSNQLAKDIYEAIDFDKLIDNHLYTASATGGYSYLNVLGSFIHNEDAWQLLWNDYFAIVDLADDEGNVLFEDAATAAAIEKMFSDFFSLTPYERYQFICSLYSNYRSANIDGFAFDYSEFSTGTFINIIATYYTAEGKLPESTHALFQKLLIATEQYGIRYKYLTSAASAVDEFKKLMQEIVTEYEGLSAADKDAFNALVGFAYNTNYALYTAATTDMPAIDTLPLLDELKSVLEAYYAIMARISEDSEAANTEGTYALLFATYEKACALRDQILASDDDALIGAYLYYSYITLNTNDENQSNDWKLTLEAVFDTVNSSSLSYTLSLENEDGTKTSYNAVEYYTNAGIVPFLQDSYKVLYTYFIGNANTKEDMLALMSKLRALDKDQLEMFYSLNIDAIYYSALEAFFTSNLENDTLTAALATALITAEQEYQDYSFDTEDAEALAAFKTAWEAAAAEFAKVSDTTNYTSLLKDMYEYYLEKYNTLPTEEPAA